MLQPTMPIKRIGESEVPTISISESSPFLSGSASEAPSLSGDSFPGGGAWNPKKKKQENASQRRTQKIRNNEEAIAA
jgi:hypothetical protein